MPLGAVVEEPGREW